MKVKYDIKELIQAFKEGGDDENIIKIIECMLPSINKYSRNAYWENYEDMQQEFKIAVIEAVDKIKIYNQNGAIIKFLSNAIRNKFYEMYRSHKLRMDKSMEMIELENITNFQSEVNGYINIEFYEDLSGLISCKSLIRKEIVHCIVAENLADKEIALKLNVSRQYVNRCKKEIFKELKEYSLL